MPTLPTRCAFYVCAPALAREHVLLMADVIKEFHDSYRNCFPDETVKPKFHYTLHYPHLFMMFGPLVHLQTLRFEGKRNYFKELVFRTKNKGNLCKSLAERHQFYQSTFNTRGGGAICVMVIWCSLVGQLYQFVFLIIKYSSY